VITLAAEDKDKNRHERSMSLKEYFVTVGTLILRGKGEEQDLSIALLWGIFRGVGHPVLWAEASVPFTQSLFLLFAKGLIDVEHTLIEVEEEDMFGFMNTKSIFKSSDSTPSRRKVQKQQSSWKLTDYGKKQFGLLWTPSGAPRGAQSKPKRRGRVAGAGHRAPRQLETR
jgi:hypothetical protein